MIKRRYVIILFITLVLFATTNYCDSLDEKNMYEGMIDNILLVGKDSGDGSKTSRSDTMIILTIDSINKSLKLTSLARDTLVNIPNRGFEKLNHAYAYGGVDLLLNTINTNLGLDIKDYAIVDFNSFIEIIDTLEGVDITIDEREIEHLNKVIEACYSLSFSKEGNIEYITSSGEQNLNGYQALAYARIRKIDSIYKRDERQRKILTNIAYKLSNTSITKYPSIVKSLVKYVDVNISINKIMKIALKSHELASYEIKQLEFPQESYRNETKLNDSFVIDWDKEKNIEILKKFMYGN